MRRIQRAESPGDADAIGQFGRAEVPDVFLAQSPVAVGGQFGAQPLLLGGRGRHRQLAALDQIGVDALGAADPRDLIHRLLKLPLQVKDGRHRPPGPRAYRSRDPGSALVSQPPLRPEAPNPAKAASSSTTRSDGSACFR